MIYILITNIYDCECSTTSKELQNIFKREWRTTIIKFDETSTIDTIIAVCMYLLSLYEIDQGHISGHIISVGINLFILKLAPSCSLNSLVSTEFDVTNLTQKDLWTPMEKPLASNFMLQVLYLRTCTK